jgi:hypothetical protein
MSLLYRHLLVESQEFRDLVDELDMSYKVSSHSSLSKQLEQVLCDMRANIKIHLESARKIHLACDIWTKNGMSESFLGITAHFISKHKLHRVTLAVRRMPSQHTGDRIREVVEDILREWGLGIEKVGKILTDNGSNMVKAFKSIVTRMEKEATE